MTVPDVDELVVTPAAGGVGGAARERGGISARAPTAGVARDVQRGRGGREARHRRDARDAGVAHERAPAAMPAPAQRLGNSLDPAAVASSTATAPVSNTRRSAEGDRENATASRARAPIGEPTRSSPGEKPRARDALHARLPSLIRASVRANAFYPARPNVRFPPRTPRSRAGRGSLGDSRARRTQRTRACRSKRAGVARRSRARARCAALGARRHLRDPSAAGNLENQPRSLALIASATRWIREIARVLDRRSPVAPKRSSSVLTRRPKDRCVPR